MEKISATDKPRYLLATTSLALWLGVSLLTPSAMAQAQPVQAPAENDTEDDGETMMEEMLVTATRRAASVQDIGVSVNAYDGDELRLNNIDTTEDLTLLTPGLSVIEAGGAPLAGLVAIRGVAQNDFAAHLESANVFYVDDAYRPSNGGNLANLFDIARVEVLKGPQGTLFGRNATGGLIHTITQDPTEEFGGYVELRVAEFNTVQVEGALNVPINETTAFRVAGFASHNDGFIENDIGPDQQEMDTVAIRGKFLTTLNDRIRIKLQVEYSRDESDAAGGAFPTGGEPGPDGLGVFRPAPAFTDTGFVDADGDVFTGSFDEDGFFRREELNLIADIQFEFGRWTMTSISAYNYISLDYLEDNDLTPFDVSLFNQPTDQQTFTQEFRFNGDYDRFRITAGAFYLNLSGDFTQGFQINNLGNFADVLGLPPFLLEALGLPPSPLLVPLGQFQFADYSLGTDSYSAYVQGEYDISERVTLTAGVRYTYDTKDFTYLNTCLSLIGSPLACPPADPLTLAGAGLIEDSSDEGGVSARVQLDFRATEDWLVYVSYNRGYKAFNYNAGFAGAALVEDLVFDGETLNAYEIGSKLDFWQGRARFNVAGFFYDYNDYQAFDQQGVSFILTNQDARIFGGEAELHLTPGYGLDLRFGLTAVDTEVEDIPIAGVLQDVEAPQAPSVEFTYTLAKTFDTEYGTFRAGINGSYIGSYFSQLSNAEVTRAGDNFILNVRGTYTAPSGNWEASVFARNALNDALLQYAFDITFPG
ncbi:MAG: TonB-dependent receptor, partial [Pseudomonadota bacterium]